MRVTNQSHAVFLEILTVAQQKRNPLPHKRIKNELKIKIFAFLGRYAA
jgi:hypothetical protein